MAKSAIWYWKHGSTQSSSHEMIAFRIKVGYAGVGILTMLYEHLLEHPRLDAAAIKALRTGLCLGGDEAPFDNIIDQAILMGLLTKDNEGLIMSPFIESVRVEREQSMAADRERKSKSKKAESESENSNTNSYSYSKESSGIRRIPAESNQGPQQKQDPAGVLQAEANQKQLQNQQLNGMKRIKALVNKLYETCKERDWTIAQPFLLKISSTENSTEEFINELERYVLNTRAAGHVPYDIGSVASLPHIMKEGVHV